MTRSSRLYVLLERRWRLAQRLLGARAGCTVPSLVEHLSVSRATLYRDLDFLRTVAPLVTEVVNGETRYRLLGDAAVPVSPLRSLALDLALATLDPLRGTKLVGELARMRKDLPRGSATSRISITRPPVAHADDVVSAVERALAESRELVLRYRGAKDEAVRERTVQPLELCVVKGQLYLVAHDPSQGASRTFKVARVASARVAGRFDRAAVPSAEPSPSVVIWRGPQVLVVVRLSPTVARFAGEYPLVPQQRVVPAPDGSVHVHAEVAGEVEALRWVLSWGKDATVVAPPSLRLQHLEELRAGLAAYEDQRVSHVC